MVDSQPGTVAAFDPSVSLSNFSAENRDRLMFNENQLVLAKIQRIPPSFATARCRINLSMHTPEYTEFDQFKNLEGEYVYIDNQFYDLESPGVPTLDVHQIVIGFDRQVTTDTIVIWSVSFVTSSALKVEYSFDNNTWFDVGTVNWVQVFDDTLELFPGESPPTGEFEYTGTFASGDITARYWRIRSDAETNFISESGSDPSKTITVGSTNGFPSSGTLTIVRDNNTSYTVNYTGKTSTTFTGCDTDGQAGDSGYIVFNNYAFANRVTELRVVQSTSPLIQHWNSDGTQAVTNALEGEDYYDLAYDKNEDVYYALRLNTDINGVFPGDPDDDFNADTGTDFDAVKWFESTTNSYFQHSTASGTLDMRSSGGDGQLEATYGIDGGFISDIELVAVVRLSNNNSYFALESKGFEDGNQHMVSLFKGPHVPPTSTAMFAGATMAYLDTVAGAAELRDFRIRPEGFDFSYSGGIVEYTFTYVSSTNLYTILASGITHPSATPGVPYTMDSATFTISNISTPANGDYFSVTVVCGEVPAVGTTTSGVALQLERIGTNGYIRYADSDAPGVFDTLLIGNVPNSTARPQLYGSPGGAAVTLSADNFEITGGTLFYDSPVFSVVTLDKSGNLKQVSGLSDADGYAIKSFDIISNPQATYLDYLHPRAMIATNGAAEGSGGEIYIKINDTLYKYLKSALPIVTETGAGASVTTTGEIPSTGITNFAYHGYTQGALSYIKHEPELDGVFLKTIASTTLLATALKAKLDVTSINYPFAWNVSDLSTLYFIDSDALMLYDLNETKVAFVVVTSNKQVLAAGTGETAIITAQVLNVYGEPKSAKSMTFTVTAGDGALSPATGCSDGNGSDTTTYTVGSAVGTTSITVSVSDTTCT